MGKKPDQVERDIKEQRARITSRIEGLQRRVRDDLDSAQGAAKGHVNHAVRGTKETLRPSSLLEEHPISSIAGALGIGVVLGMAGGGGGAPQAGDSYAYASSRRNGSGGGEPVLSSLLGSILTPAARAAQDELQGLVREGFAALRQQASEVASNATGDPYRQNRDVGVQ